MLEIRGMRSLRTVFVTYMEGRADQLAAGVFNRVINSTGIRASYII